MNCSPRFVALVLVAPVLVALGVAPLPAQNEAAFAKSLDQVRKTMNRGAYKRAKSLLDEALKKNEKQLYAKVRRPEIVALATQCAFRIASPPPKLQSLISGKLKKWNPRTGEIELEYTPSTMQDFYDPAVERRKREAAQAKAEEERRERERRKNPFGVRRTTIKLDPNKGRKDWPTPVWHSMHFQGPYEIEISGASYKVMSDSSLSRTRYVYPGVVLLVGVRGDEFFSAEAGYASGTRPSTRSLRYNYRRATAKPRIAHYVGKGQPVTLSESDYGAFEEGEPFHFVVRVDEKAIAGYASPYKKWRKNWWKSKKVRGYIGAKWPSKRTDLGTFGLQAKGWDKMVIRGRASPSWMQGLQDTHFQKKWITFEKGFDPATVLPDWIAAPLPKLAKPDLDNEPIVPDDLDYDTDVYVRRLFGLMHENKYGVAYRAAVEKAKRKELPAGTAAYVRALCLRSLDRPAEALIACDELLKEMPDFFYGQELRARVLVELKRPLEAVQQIDKTLAAHPKATHLHLEALIILVRTGHRDQATERMRGHLQKHGASREIMQLQRMLTMIEHGPTWPRVYEYKSRHYVVRSDIGEDVCRDAAKLLEEAFIAFQTQTGWVKKANKRGRLRVYLFRGQLGYSKYAAQILGDPSPHTAGLYSPSLQQLLIWNLPDRQQMFRTVRHEGFHQYLHALVGTDIPSWFNEGMAEYWETAVREKGKLRGGQWRNDHIETLGANLKKRTPLAQFLYVGHRGFYAKASVHYAQAWQLVHFLQSSTRENRKIFDTLIEELRNGSDRKAAVKAAFAGVDLEAFEAALGRHTSR